MQFGDEKNNLIILQSYFFNILIIQALRKYNAKMLTDKISFNSQKFNFCIFSVIQSSHLFLNIEWVYTKRIFDESFKVSKLLQVLISLCCWQIVTL